MIVVSLVWLWLATAAVLLFMAWIGWRFFVRAVPIGSGVFTASLYSGSRWLRSHLVGVISLLGVMLRAGVGRTLLGGVLVLIFTMGLAYSMRGSMRPDRGVPPLGQVVGSLGQMFAPDELVPPPALPPAFFVSPEDPGLGSADRDWAKLDAGFRRQLLEVIERAGRRGVALTLLEGYRSPERQTYLASAGSQVTRAGAFQSKHQYGRAADLVPVRNGMLAMNESDPWVSEAYRVLGEEAERAGLTWGGRWGLRDLGHVELAGALAARR